MLLGAPSVITVPMIFFNSLSLSTVAIVHIPERVLFGVRV